MDAILDAARQPTAWIVRGARGESGAGHQPEGNGRDLLISPHGLMIVSGFEVPNHLGHDEPGEGPRRNPTWSARRSASVRPFGPSNVARETRPGRPF